MTSGVPPSPLIAKTRTLRSERAMIVIGIIALVSSLMLWWANNLYRSSYPNHVALSDNLQQARRFIAQAIIFQGKHLAGEPVTAGEALAALDNAALKVRDCLDGRSTLQGVAAAPPTDQTLVLLQSYREGLARLDRTVRNLLVAKENVESLRIQQLKEFHETEQLADAVETEQALQLAAVIVRQQREQRVGLACWLVFLLGSFFLLLRATSIEAAQAQQQQLMHALLDSTTDAVFVKDQIGRYLLCNEAAQRVIGKTASELIGRTDRDAFPAEIAEQLMARDREIMESGTVSNHEEQIVTLSGESLVFLVAKGVIRDREGQVTGLYGISRDVTKERRDQEQLQRHRVLLQRTSRLAKVGGWEFDPHTGLGSWTEECARIHDLEPTASMSVEQGLSYYHGEHRAAIEQAVRDAVELGRPYDLELELVSAKGVRKWVRTQCEPVMAEGQVRYVYGALQDITERKEAEASVQRSDLALREAQRLAEIGSWQWDVASGRHTWSEEVHRIYGRDPSLPPADYPEVRQYFTPESWRGLSEEVERCLRQGGAYVYDAEVVRPDGGRRWITVRGEAGRGENGAVECLRGTVQDITERKQMEETLRASEVRYRTLFEQSMDAIAIMDGFPPQIRYVNPAFVELFGYTEIEMRAMGGGDVWRLVHPEDLAMVQERVRERMDGRVSALRYEFRIVRKDGEIRWVEATGIRADRGGQAVNQAIYRDITPRKKAEEEQEKLLAQLMQAQKMESVGRLAGGVAHDFNNMLSVILGLADFIEEQLEPNSPMRGDLQEIKKAGQRSVELTRQLLAFARKQTVSPKVLNINATVEGLLKMLRRLIGEDIALVWAPAAELWTVRIDPTQVDQILANLCVNARDAIGGTGKLTIETGNVTLDAEYCAEHLEYVPGEYVLLAVSDDGCGMDKEILAKIFEPFFTTKGMGEGTGLGLSTVYGIVRQNNGFINVYSEPGQGTTLKIYLPRHGGQALEELSESFPAADGAGRIILLVEDETALLQLNQRMLTSLGYTVLAASTPGEAIRLARESQGRIDLLLTDVVMPEMNGRELAAKLHSFLPTMKQVFMSGYTANVIAHHGVLDEGVYFLQKPFLKKDLAAKINAALAQSPQDPAA